MRNLNIETIRIVAMLLVVFGHIAGGFIQMSMEASVEVKQIMSLLCFFCAFHVNLFVLISGYCGIKSILKSLFKLYVLLLSVQIVVFLLAVSCHVAPPSLTWPIKSFVFPLTHNDWWFMKVYAMLCIIAPGIEKLVSASPRRTLVIFTISLLVIDIYFNYVWRVLDTGGYDIIHFVAIYSVGMCLRLVPGLLQYRKHKLPLYILCLFVVKVFIHLLLKSLHLEDHYMDYNNPFNIAIAILIFVYMINLKISSKRILIVSSSVVSVYLFSEHPIIRQWIISQFEQGLAALKPDIVGECLFVLATLIIIFVIGILLDKLRLFVFRPFILFAGLVEKKVIKISEYEGN